MFCDTGGKLSPGAATRPSPDSRWEGQVLPPDFNPTGAYQGVIPLGEQILVCGVLENHRHISRWWHICQHITGQPASIVCGNLARFSISPSCCIAVADECVSLFRERTKSLWKSGFQGLGVCMTLHVCVFVSVYLKVFIPYFGCEIILFHLCPHHSCPSGMSCQRGEHVSCPLASWSFMLITSFSSELHLTSWFRTRQGSHPVAHPVKGQMASPSEF